MEFREKREKINSRAPFINSATEEGGIHWKIEIKITNLEPNYKFQLQFKSQHPPIAWPRSTISSRSEVRSQIKSKEFVGFLIIFNNFPIHANE
jgi:hypothetical protein